MCIRWWCLSRTRANVTFDIIFRSALLALLALACAIPAAAARAADKPLRPPSVPLITVDPYFSVWSAHDFLTDGQTTHWTGKEHPIHCLVRIDGKVYRAIGTDPFYTPPMRQTGLQLTPTRSIYSMETDKVKLTLTFMTPLLPDDLDSLSRPVSYVTWDVRSNDGEEHEVLVYLEVSAILAVNTPDQKINWSRPDIDRLAVMRIGTEEQPILAKKGDDLRIDWGYLYVAAPKQDGLRTWLGSGDHGQGCALTKQSFPATDDPGVPRAAGEGSASALVSFDLGKVGRTPVSRYVILAYDDLYSMEYMGRRLRPYWRRNGAEAADMLRAAAKDYASLVKRCEAFDRELIADLTTAGGRQYADIGTLAYRQCFGAGKLCADADGTPLYFSKECFSNGCTGTVDVIYPSCPQYLLFNPALLKASLEPVLRYAASPRWKFPFAPHDVGTYPLANGQVYGGGEETEVNQMPVEESANMLLMVAAIARAEDNADFAARHWPVIEKWAEYLKGNGMDPREQLCTDDFAGHLAHNVNLSAKSILALGAFACLCEQLGKTDQARAYRQLAQKDAAQWLKLADDGDHYRLAFDRPGTWSLKYNLVWDRILGLGLFPPEIARKEVAHYRRVQKPYGVPLDNRENWSKLDWITWCAALTGDRKDFEALIAPVHAFLNESPSRVPMSDWHWSETGRAALFAARPTVGAAFMGMLNDPAMWKKWAGRARP